MGLFNNKKVYIIMIHDTVYHGSKFCAYIYNIYSNGNFSWGNYPEHAKEYYDYKEAENDCWKYLDTKLIHVGCDWHVYERKTCGYGHGNMKDVA